MRILICLASGAFIGAIAAWLCWAFIPSADEVSPHLDATGSHGGKTHSLPAMLIESTLTVRSPYQFVSDTNGDWCFTEEWDDGTVHQVRIHFTTISAQGAVTEWVEDALTAKADDFLRGGMLGAGRPTP